ncbi:MAG: shikimate kinase [Acetivibrio ethanolgignens]
MKDNIILIGFMGCGKTSIGTRLSQRLSYSFLDTDEQIKAKEGRSINPIFSEKGEAYFREIETRTVRELLETTEKTVISTGGGLPLKEINGKLLQQLGFVVYLDVTKETVMERLARDTTRPLLNGPDKEKRVEELLSFRQPIYEYTAHITVNTNQRDFDDIIDDIIRNYEIMMAREKEKKENENHEITSKDE